MVAIGPATIRGAEYPVHKLFSNDFEFIIPPYQRPYAWTTQEAGELFVDLTSWMGDPSEPLQDADPYFLGSVVLIKDTVPRAEVVDGQQRLISLTILFSAMAHALATDTRAASNVRKMIRAEDDIIAGISGSYRLKPRPRDEAFFRTQIQDRIDETALKAAAGLIDSQSNMRDNALLFVNLLKKMSAEQVLRLAQYAAQKCFVVAVTTSDRTSAYRVFSVLNNRGLELSHADILKADVLGPMKETDQVAYTQTWENYEDAFGRQAFIDLFSHIRMIYRKRKQKEGILEEIQESAKPSVDPKRFVDKTLVPLAEAYHDVLWQSYQATAYADEVNRQFKWLNLVDNSDWVPPAIKFLAMNRQDPALVLRFMRSLERLATSMMIRRTYINDRIDRYGRLLQWTEDGKDPWAADSPLDLSPSEKADTVAALDGDLYKLVKVRLPVLLRLDHEVATGQVTSQYSSATVEHVLPQQPAQDSQWLKDFPDEAERDSWVHRIANLVLLSRYKNSQASNLDFTPKKEQYFKVKGTSPFPLTVQVLSETVWTPEVLGKRQADLMDVLRRVWDLR